MLGRGLSQAAESLRALPLKLVLEPGMSERELASRYARGRRAASTRWSTRCSATCSPCTCATPRRARSISALERSGGQLPGSREVAVCFADLVGFTRLGEEVPPDELGRLAARLEALASEVAEPPVQLVKTIGDAAMLASPEPEPLLDAALNLLDAADAEGEDFPQLRAGAALGLALPRAGDWFGRPVNLASRITSIARPGSVLAEREVRESARERLRLVLRRRAAPARYPRAGGAVPGAPARAALGPSARPLTGAHAARPPQPPRRPPEAHRSFSATASL